MFYILMYGLLAFVASTILKSSQSMASNISVLLFAFIIFYIMFKRYIKEFGNFDDMLAYHKRLFYINDKEQMKINQDNLELDIKYNEKDVVTFKDKRKPPQSDGDKVVIDDERFIVSKKRWFYLLFSFFAGELFMPGLNNFAYFIFSIADIIVLFVAMAPLVIESYHGFKRAGLLKSLKWMIIGVVLVLAFNVFYNSLLTLLKVPVEEPGNQSLIVLMLQKDFLRVAFEATIAAAIFEEFIFRGLGFREFFSKSKVLAYIITFFVFGLPHLFVGFSQGAGLFEFIYLPIYGMMGVIFAYTYDKTDSIFTAMGTHFISNLISIVAITFL